MDMYVDIVISNVFNLNKHFFFSFFFSKEVKQLKKSPYSLLSYLLFPCFSVRDKTLA